LKQDQWGVAGMKYYYCKRDKNDRIQINAENKKTPEVQLKKHWRATKIRGMIQLYVQKWTAAFSNGRRISGERLSIPGESATWEKDQNNPN
jgi:hypothetical protein